MFSSNYNKANGYVFCKGGVYFSVQPENLSDLIKEVRKCQADYIQRTWPEVWTALGELFDLEDWTEEKCNLAKADWMTSFPGWLKETPLELCEQGREEDVINLLMRMVHGMCA